VLRRPMTIHDWTFVFALPTRESEFLAGKATSDFCYVPPPLLTWADYQVSVTAHVEQHILPFERLGLKIVRFPTVSQYARCMTGYRGVVLFTHCARQRQLEFRGGLIAFHDLVRCLDRRFRGIGEICACAPNGLQEMLKARAPNAAFKISAVELSLRLWMIYYSTLFTAFSEAPCDFWTASLRAQAFVAQRSAFVAATI